MVYIIFVFSEKLNPSLTLALKIYIENNPMDQSPYFIEFICDGEITKQFFTKQFTSRQCPSANANGKKRIKVCVVLGAVPQRAVPFNKPQNCLVWKHQSAKKYKVEAQIVWNLG